MKRYIRIIALMSCLFVMATAAFAQQTGSIRGQVSDTFDAAIVGAQVVLTDAAGVEKTAVTNENGQFTITGLSAGVYTVKVSADGFAAYDNSEVEVSVGERTDLTIPLAIAVEEVEVEVSENQGVSTEPEATAGATVLKEEDLEALPDDPDDLQAALQALAGPSAGPDGGQIYIDGFTGGQMPPKESIREIRINNNPFSAEFDRLGFGRIEILTKPGTDKFRGSFNANFNDESLNSRNPFATNRAPSQRRAFGGNLSGPLQKGKSSFFIDVNHRSDDTNSIINAVILDNALNLQPFQRDVQVPTRRFSIGPRLDYQINDKNTLVFRYNYWSASAENQGIGNTTLPERAYTTDSNEHDFRITETMIINPKTINETRFEFEREVSEQTGDNTIPSITVGAAFAGGGSQIGNSFTKANNWELQNYTTTSFGASSQHAVKFGVRLRGTSYRSRSENNFGGTYTFANIDTYRDAILGNAYPLQYTITTGDPEQKVSQTDVGFFVTDDWRISPGLTMSFGLRYENQNNIDDNLNFAPRFSVAWAPWASKPNGARTVFRGGVGVFYDRVSDNLTLQALRFNGINSLNLTLSDTDPDPAVRAAAIALLQQAVFTPGGVTNVPTADQILAVLPGSSIVREISPIIQAPMMVQASLGVEHQFPRNTSLGVYYIGARTWNVLRTRNINAPICFDLGDCTGAVRPDPLEGNIYQYEASGTSNQNQMIINFRTNFSQMFSLWGNYRLGFANSDTDGAGSSPSYTYDMSNEYGRSSFDVRHNFVVGGNISMPWEISASPFVIISSGRPFNITTGRDLNGDSFINDRPAFATDLNRQCDFGTQGNPDVRNCVVRTEWGDFDLQPIAGQTIIPRNYGTGPGSVTANLRLSKNFGFGKSAARDAGQSGPQGGGMRGGLPGGGRGGRGGRGGGGFGGGFGGGERKPYNLNLSINFQNIFNIVNLGNPIGNLSSERFGQSISTGGGFGGFGGGGSSAANRRIELGLRFSF